MTSHAPGGPWYASLRYVVRISVARRLCAKRVSCSLFLRNSRDTRRASARYERRMPSWAFTTGGLTKRKDFPPAGPPPPPDQLERAPGQPLGQLPRIRDRRRRADEDRIR